MKEVHTVSGRVADICPIFETTPQYVKEPRSYCAHCRIPTTLTVFIAIARDAFRRLHYDHQYPCTFILASRFVILLKWDLNLTKLKL